MLKGTIGSQGALGVSWNRVNRAWFFMELSISTKKERGISSPYLEKNEFTPAQPPVLT